MMVRPLTIVLLLWYGGLALVGPAMHELLGCCHHDEIIAPEGPGVLAFGERGVVAAAIRASDATDDDDDCQGGQECPLCKFLAMAQSVSVARCATLSTACVAAPQPLLCETHIAAPWRSFSIRAPPVDRPIA
jgi:hypothetical protein